MEDAAGVVAGCLRNLAVVAPEATAAAADALVEETAGADTAAEKVEDPAPEPAPSKKKSAPAKVAYHPNVRCVRGGGRRGPVIVGPMYRVGEKEYVCAEMATEDEKTNGLVEPAKRWAGPVGSKVEVRVEGYDLRDWAAADIQGLRGADGTLDLEGAILCGMPLKDAQLQGANLRHAQLQGADLRRAQLQGASLWKAQLQGALLYEAQLQGADLSNADLSVLPKGSLNPKRGEAGETEETKKDKPTRLGDADLSVLPKGSEYQTGEGVEKSDAARPTNLTDTKASGADFSGANLSGATFTAATLKDATLKGAKSAPYRPPERPALGALSGAWRIKSLLGSVGRAVLATADDDDDDDDDDSNGESEEEEEAPDGVRATMEQVVESCRDNLAVGAQVFMFAADKLLSKVEEQRKVHPFTDSALEDRLSEALIEKGVKHAAILDTLSIVVISPLLVNIRDAMPEVIKEVLSELQQPGNEANEAAKTAGQQLLEAFEDDLLDAGKAAVLKRLSPIVSKWLQASREHVASRPAVDEEQARLLHEPENSAKCLVRELWPALLATLKARVSDIILSSALPAIEKASKSVRQIAGRLDELERALIAKSGQLATKFGLTKSEQLATKFGLTVKDGKGGLRSRLLKSTLTAATQYEVSVSGFKGSIDMARLAWKCSRAKLTKHENELDYLKEELKKLKDMTTTDQTWRDVTETWQATLDLLKNVEVERGVAVL